MNRQSIIQIIRDGDKAREDEKVRAAAVPTSYYYRFSQPRDHLQWRLVLGYYDQVKLLTKGLLAKLA